jgi:muramoyltetrapeptide carboxypeptidase
MQRRNFLQSLASIPLITSASIAKTNPIIKPARLKVGDTIGLVCPAAPAFSKEGVKITAESLQALGFKVKYGKRMWERYGYLAGKDAERAADINEMFADSSVQGIVCVHGGWGVREFCLYWIMKPSVKTQKLSWVIRILPLYYWVFTLKQAW